MQRKNQSSSLQRRAFRLLPFLLAVALFLLPGCGERDDSMTAEPGAAAGTRDNTPVCLVPDASGSKIISGNDASIDLSGADSGYIRVDYTGSAEKIRLRITSPDDVVYTYVLTSGRRDSNIFPLTAGNGAYKAAVYTSIQGDVYATSCAADFSAAMDDPFLPFLYPNQYIWFTQNSACVELASHLVKQANDDLDAVSILYNYVTANVTYDTEKAENVEAGYIPDPDEVLRTKRGICLDYASLLCAMLRSQRIPAQLEVGYAGTVYHAWLSVYIDNIGWINGMIRFDGRDWTIMDPTFAANSAGKKLRNHDFDLSLCGICGRARPDLCRCRSNQHTGQKPLPGSHHAPDSGGTAIRRRQPRCLARSGTVRKPSPLAARPPGKH